MSFTSVLYFLVCVIQVLGEPRKYIVGGATAPPNAYPYQASLRRNTEHFCGGSIISEKCVLTAAHCTVVPCNQFLIHVGTSYQYKHPGTTYECQAAVVHHGYRGNATANDIALIFVKTIIKFTPFVQKIALADAAPSHGEMAVITGWGYTDSDGTVMQDELQVLTVRVLELERCKKYNPIDPNFPNDLVTDAHVCTLNAGGQGTCQGDSGGPLVCRDKQVGLVSFAGDKCAINKPDVYTSIPYFRKWISRTAGI